MDQIGAARCGAVRPNPAILRDALESVGASDGPHMPFRTASQTNPKSQIIEGFLIGQVTVANPLQTSPRHRTDTAWSFGTQVRAADLTLNSPPLSSVNATFARVLNGQFWEALRNASSAKLGGPFSPSD
jgi:hypothetical protein